MPAKHEVVISGVSGRFSECDNFEELQEKLFGKINMVTVDDRRWKPGELNVPAGLGKIKNPNVFDVTFFGIHRKLCQIMDPTTRLSMQESFSAICDAGVNPMELSGTNAAVFMASVTSETEYECVMGAKNLGHAMLGHSRTMQANRISYFLNLKGPSTVVDASWCGGGQGLQYAHDMISEGHIDSALVGVCSLVSKPEVSIHYQGMGCLSKDNLTRSYSADAEGYARSEACVVFLVQRKEDARRSYGTLKGCLSYNFGAREVPFTEFSSEHYKQILKEVYSRYNVDPKKIAYFEGNGSASKVADAKELNSVAEVILQGQPPRSKPLYVGSVKSNLGHTEGASNLVSVAKALIALKTGIIPPNINYTKPNPDVPALVEGKMAVVTEPTPLEDDCVAVSCAGTINNFCHLVIERNANSRPERTPKGELPPDGLPRLVLISGREEKSFKDVINKLNNSPVDEEFVALTHRVFKDGIKGHLIRGYTVLDAQTTSYNQTKPFAGGERRPLWFMFSGMGSQWAGMGTQLMALPIFAASIQKCHETLKPKGLDLINIITSDDPTIFDSILNCFVGIAAVQIGLMDVLNELGLTPDGIVGHSVGELGCAYADGCFTAEQMILSAYARGKASVDATLIKGMMAAVGMGYNQIKDELPESIEVACHNSATSCTLSGPAEDVEKYVNQLKERGVFAKMVNVANIAYHSKHIKPAAPALHKYLKEVIPEPKPRSKKWISSSVPETDWGSELAQFSSAEYHTNNLLSSVLFEEATTHVPNNAIVVEIAPHGLLQAIVKRSLSTCTHIPLTNRSDPKGLNFFLAAIGKLYLEGISVNVEKLYPPVQFPVSRETPYLHTLITWDHSEEYIIWNLLNTQGEHSTPGWKYITYSATDDKFIKFGAHRINGNTIIPPTAHLDVIQEIHMLMRQNNFRVPVAVENFKVHTFPDIPPQSSIEVYYVLQRGSGNFEVCVDHNPLLSGKLVQLEDTSKLQRQPPYFNAKDFDIEINHDEFYSFLGEKGYRIYHEFALVNRIALNEKAFRAEVRFEGKFVEFLTAVLSLLSFYYSTLHNSLQLVTEFIRMEVDYSFFPPDQVKEVKVSYDSVTKTLYCQGLVIFSPETKTPEVPILKTEELSFEVPNFVRYSNPSVHDANEMLNICSQIVTENVNVCDLEGRPKLTIIDIQDIPLFNEAVQRLHVSDSRLQIAIKSCVNEESADDLFANEIAKECVWVVSASGEAKNIIEVVKYAKQGFVLTKIDKAIGKDSALTVISDFTFGGEKFGLFKTEITKKREIVSVEVEGEGWTSTLLYHLQKQSLEKEDQRKFVYVTGRIESNSTILALIEECRTMPHSYLTRFLFYDSKAPQFNAESPIYAKQIKKDVKVSILRNNEWGGIRFLQMDEIQQEAVTSYTPSSTVDLSTLGQIPNIKVSKLGLNLEGICGRQSDSLGVIEYSGLDKNGTLVMGLATLDESNVLVPDPILQWPCPKGWSLEQAATAPLVYAMGVYMLDVVSNFCPGDTILIHRGVLPVSQALINISLGKGYDLYTTYSTLEEKKKIKSLFPEIPDKKIVSCATPNFDIDILKLTDGKGLGYVVNTLEDPRMVTPATLCVEKHGIYYQLGETPMRDKACMGMLFFLKEILALGVTPQSLLDLKDNLKLEVKAALNTAFECGWVKPFPVTKVSSSELSSDVVSIIKDQTLNGVRVYTSLDSKESPSEKKIFLCEPHKNYIVVGVQQSLWVEIVEWLVSRGAKQIYVLLKHHILNGSNALRLNVILNRHFGVRVNLVSYKRITSKPCVENLLQEIVATGEIGCVFFLGSIQKEKISIVDETLREHRYDCPLICVGQGGEQICEKRQSDGLKSLCLRCSTTSLVASSFLPHFDDLIFKPRSSPVVLLKKYFTLRKDQNSANDGGLSINTHIPETLAELYELNKLNSDSTEAKFREVPSHGPPYSRCKEIAPIFLIPSLKPTQSHCLATKIFHPVFEARLPIVIESFDKAATQLAKEIVKFPFNYLTLVADDWGGALALNVMRYLEAEGKVVRLILLNAAPQTVQTWAEALIDVDDFKLINKYLKITPEKRSELMSVTGWENKLEKALELAGVDDDDKAMTRDALTALRSRIEQSASCNPSDTKVNGKVHLFRCKTASINDQCQLDQYCKRAPRIHLTETETHEELINDEKTARDINSLILFEYRDAAVKPDDDMVGANIIRDSKFKSAGLIRA